MSFVELRPSGESHTTTWRQNYRTRRTRKKKSGEREGKRGERVKSDESGEAGEWRERGREKKSKIEEERKSERGWPVSRVKKP